jgi:hypothetical protein
MKTILRKMTSALLLATVVVALFVMHRDVAAEVECTYYASPHGGGNGLSRFSPFRIADFWRVAGPGRTLCLLDGVYTDSISPPQNLNGIASARITIRALNDGRVRINGGGVRIPVRLVNNDYFLLEGFDAHNSSGGVIHIGKGADYNIVRRVCAWDTPIGTNDVVFGVHRNKGNLLEDVCGLGKGRKIFTGSQGGNNLTIRRAWGRWEEHTSDSSPKSTFNLAYNGFNQVCENCIGTWSGPAGSVKQPQAIFRAGPSSDPSGWADTKPKYLGSIAYVLSGTNYQPSRLIYHSDTAGTVFRDVVAYTEQSKQPFVLSNLAKLGALCIGCSMSNTTEIGGTSSRIGNEWSTTNRVVAADPSKAPSVWNGSGSSGARVCKRYVNGNLTSQPLWPWPMNQRIINAMKSAGKTPVDVTKTMEQIFGPIPTACRSGSNTSVSDSSTLGVPPAPENLVIEE